MKDQQIVSSSNWAALAITLITVAANAPASADSASGSASSGFSLATAFTYEGALNQNGESADGLYDFQYELYDRASGGTFLGGTSRFDQVVRGGAFATELDFGRSVAGGDLWLQIQVRDVGEGPFTTLTPRQHLSSPVGTCTLDSNLRVNGQLTIAEDDEFFPPLWIPTGNDVEPSDLGGFATFGDISGLNITIDDNEIMARDLGISTLYLNADGGDVGINLPGGAVNANLHVFGDSSDDASPGGGGIAVFGPTDGGNIAIDGNEIMARNNGSTSTLYLNNDGGDVEVGGRLFARDDLEVGGTLDIGWRRVIGPGGDPIDQITCDAGQRLLSGGCAAGGNQLEWSFPASNETWSCRANGIVFAYAICGNVQ